MDVHYSSKTDAWATPQCFFDRLDDEFNFVLDPCADELNAKCSKYYTKEDDGLSQDWDVGGNVFMNPPYGRVIGVWIRKAYTESCKGVKVVALIPARTDTRYWHEYVMRAEEIRLVRGRLKFGDGSNSAPFPSAVVVFNGEDKSPVLTTMVNYERMTAY